jgi:flagellar assembly protein FliH
MMNSLFNEPGQDVLNIPATSFLYRDMSASNGARETRQSDGRASRSTEPQLPSGPSQQEINDLIIRARAEAAAETEKRMNAECQVRIDASNAKIRQALEHFENERDNYFSRIESEVVSLALAIAAKVLHREAQVDPLLVAALVRVAIEKLHDCSTVSVRVPPAKSEKWRALLASPVNGSTIAVVEDSQLGPDDCILETDLGSANFSIDAQLKEVEQGFFDLLAQRPATK